MNPCFLPVFPLLTILLDSRESVAPPVGSNFWVDNNDNHLETNLGQRILFNVP